MTILWMGSEMGAFVPSGAAIAESTDGTTHWNASFARCGLRGTTDVHYADTTTIAAQAGDFYFHFEGVQIGPDSFTEGTNNAVALLNGSGAEVVRIRQVAASIVTYTWQVQYLNGASAWTNAGSAISLGEELGDFDLYVNVTTGAISFFASGTQRVAVTGLSLGHIPGIVGGRLYGADLHRDWSQGIMADEPTIGMRVVTRYANGAGATGDWTGDFNDIDEIVYSDADFISSGTANQVELFTQTGASITGYRIRAVGVTARAKKGGSGPTKLRLMLRTGGTTYDNGADLTLGVGYGAHSAIWATNPNTSAAWAVSDLTGLQFGVKSIA